MIINGYIDESYSGRQQEGIFTLCCVFVPHNILAWLEFAWAKVIAETNDNLKREGRREVTRYHAAECNARSGEYEGWTKEERDAFVLKLFNVIRYHQTSHLAFSVNLNELLSVWHEGVNNLIGFAYTILLKYIMLDVGEMLHQEGLSAHLIYERGDHDADIETAFATMKADPGFHYRDSFVSIERSNWRRSILLQLADLLAYESYRERERLLPGRTRSRSRSLQELLSFDSTGARSMGVPLEAIEEIRQMFLAAAESRTQKTND